MNSWLLCFWQIPNCLRVRALRGQSAKILQQLAFTHWPLINSVSLVTYQVLCQTLSCEDSRNSIGTKHVPVSCMSTVIVHWTWHLGAIICQLIFAFQYSIGLMIILFEIILFFLLHFDYLYQLFHSQTDSYNFGRWWQGRYQHGDLKLSGNDRKEGNWGEVSIVVIHNCNMPL